jgi:hypothetical protein
MSDFKLSKYVALATPYVFGVSALYLYGFWSTFGIDIFEFIGINDVIKLVIFNSFSLGGIILIGILSGSLVGSSIPIKG